MNGWSLEQECLCSWEEGLGRETALCGSFEAGKYLGHNGGREGFLPTYLLSPFLDTALWHGINLPKGVLTLAS